MLPHTTDTGAVESGEREKTRECASREEAMPRVDAARWSADAASESDARGGLPGGGAARDDSAKDAGAINTRDNVRRVERGVRHSSLLSMRLRSVTPHGRTVAHAKRILRLQR